jgi:hypothetical protein
VLTWKCSDILVDNVFFKQKKGMRSRKINADYTPSVRFPMRLRHVRS